MQITRIVTGTLEESVYILSKNNEALLIDPGGVSFLFEEEMVTFTGDALFRGSVGRTDLPGSQPEKLLAGIEKHLFTLPNDMRVFPGHRDDSTIGHEKQTNPFFN